MLTTISYTHTHTHDASEEEGMGVGDGNKKVCPRSHRNLVDIVLLLLLLLLLFLIVGKENQNDRSQVEKEWGGRKKTWLLLFVSFSFGLKDYRLVWLLDIMMSSCVLNTSSIDTRWADEADLRQSTWRSLEKTTKRRLTTSTSLKRHGRPCCRRFPFLFQDGNFSQFKSKRNQMLWNNVSLINEWMNE